MRTLLQDLRYALRNLLKSPGFAAVAALTLAIGMGANTAIFSLIDSVLLRPLPYRDPGRLVRLYETEAAPGSYPFAGPDFLDWKAQNSTFEDMALYGWFADMNLSGEGQADHVLGAPTAANFFSVLGVKPLLGRPPGRSQDPLTDGVKAGTTLVGSPETVIRPICFLSYRNCSGSQNSEFRSQNEKAGHET